MSEERNATLDDLKIAFRFDTVNQALATEYLAVHHKRLRPEVYTVPTAIDRKVAALKLRSMGLAIDQLSAQQQQQYLSSWELGT